MSILNGQRVIAIEEHYLDPDVTAHFHGKDQRGAGPLIKKLEDVGSERIKNMDASGIDVQVLSHAPPATQRMDGPTGVPTARAANDKLHEMCKVHPDRLAGFAMLPTGDVQASADELERCVNDLGFKGAMIHGLIGEERMFFDDQKFWPIFERAEALDVPLYIHPAMPHPAVFDAYFKDYAERFPGFVTAGWGFTMETATAGIRLVLSGVLDKYPGTKIILGHLGEALPFLMWRIDMALNRPGGEGVKFKELFSKHFYITTSGFFSDPALLCSIQEMSADHILFAVDYPFVANEPGPKWMKNLMLNDIDKAKILHGNAEKLLRM
jgi:predicted TIM-barrel fold metal-dependent hydrolase